MQLFGGFVIEVFQLYFSLQSFKFDIWDVQIVSEKLISFSKLITWPILI